MNEPHTIREHLAGAAAYVVLATALPRLAYRLRWPTRLGPRGLVAYIAGVTLFHFGLGHYVLPRIKRIVDECDRLTKRLGREPTDDELADHFGYGSGD
ncbi:MAG: hypothetical protein ACR2L8_05350 [Solirubrobacteraceae bacterium]